MIKRNIIGKIVPVLVIGLTVAVLSGCGTKGAFVVDEKDAIVTITKDEDTKEVTVGVENPWVESDKEGVIEATGLNIYIPEDATDAKYSYMKTSNMAQVTYTYNGHDSWTFRKQKTDMFMDISGMYYEWVYQGETKVSGKDAMDYVYVEGDDGSGMIDNIFGVQVINWYDDTTGISYSLSVSGMDLNGMDIQVIAEHLFELEQ